MAVAALLISSRAMAGPLCGDTALVKALVDTVGGYGCNWTFNNTASGDSSTGTIFALDSRTTNSGQGCLSFERLAPAGAPTPDPSAKFNVFVDFKIAFGCTCQTGNTVASPVPDVDGNQFSCVVGLQPQPGPGTPNPAKNAALYGRRKASGDLRLQAAFSDGTSGLLECTPDPFCRP